MQTFDTNYRSVVSSSPCGKTIPRWVLWTVMAILSVGLIVAISFAIYGATKTCAYSDEECPSKPLAWQQMACCKVQCKKNWNVLPLILISLDGFRYDYLRRNKTAALNRLIECGVHAPFMYPSYPTKTFPNHFSIVTGLYPESHGIIDNTMYDGNITPPEDRLFTLSSPSALNPQWWKGEPFWNTVEKNGMKAATYFWPGSEVPIQNMTPSYTLRYNKTNQFYQRIDQLLDWLQSPDEKRPTFLTMYFDQPDTDGHEFGPDSPQVTNTLLNVDGQINYLLDRLWRADLLHCVNMVILADHGMQTVQRVIPLDNYLQTDGLAIFGGPIARIALNESGLTPEEIKKNLTCRSPQYRTYMKGDTPRRVHYANNPRIGQVIVDADLGVEITADSAYVMKKLGDHGYDNRFDTMHALFLAWGANFKRNHTIRPFQNIELYNFFADILNIVKRAPNNGTVGSMDSVFITPPKRTPGQEQPANTPVCENNPRDCGQCTAMATCNSPWTSDANLFSFSNNSSGQFCSGTICNTVLIYNNDVQLASAVLEYSAVSYSSSDNATCTRVAYSSISCETAKQMEAALSSSNMGMFSLSTAPLESTFWDLKVPMHNTFYNGVWRSMQNLTGEYIKRFGQLIVTSGSIFDKNNDGLADRTVSGSPPIPTHIYRILIRCTGQWTLPTQSLWKSCTGDLDAISFVLPNVPEIENCTDHLDYMRIHMARIRDIELLTHVNLFPDQGTDDTFHRSALLRTWINDDLW